MARTLVHKLVIDFNSNQRRKKITYVSERAESEALESFIVKRNKHETLFTSKEKSEYVFADNSAIIFFAKHFLGKWYNWVIYHNIYNDRNVNQGFPFGSNKKDFVEGALIEVMWDDSPPILSLIVESEKRPHNYKGDFDIQVFDLINKTLTSISQTQIKRLVVRDIEDLLKERLL